MKYYIFLILFLLLSCTKDQSNPTSGEWTIYQRDLQNTGFANTKITKSLPDVIWKKEKSGSSILGSPLLYNKKIYFSQGNFSILCVSQKDGELVWENETTGDVAINPAIYQNKLFYGDNDWNFYCADPETGQIFWQVGLGGDVIASPLLYNNNIIVQDARGIIYSLNIESGELNWAKEKCFGYGSPALSDGIIYAISCESLSSQSNGISLFALQASNGELLWQTYLNGGNRYCSPSIKNGKIYLGTSGNVYCINSSNGEIFWNYQTDYRLHFGTSANILDDKIIIGCNSTATGTIPAFLFCLDLNTGNEIWKFRIDDRRFQVFADPITGNNNVTLISVNLFGLMAIENNSGTLLWQYDELGGSSSSSPIVTSDKIIWGTNTGTLVALKN